MIPTAAPKRSSTSRKLIFLLLSIAFLWALSTIALFNKLSTRQNQQQFNVNDGREQDANVLRNNKDSDLYNASIFNLKDDLFCKSINEALADGPTNRTMIQTFVSNSGHLSFLYNSLLSMRDSKLPWKSLVLAIGANVCPMIMNFTSSTGIDDNVVCVPYLERLLYQLQRDEPQSLQQIQSALQENNDTSQSVYDHIEKNVFGWGGGVEYKFLINAKLYALRDVLECGSDAFITDTDIAFRQDPRPYFDMGGEEGDIIGQNDTNKDIYLVNMNSGFMYWKRTKKNLDLIDDIIKVPPFYMKNQMRVNNRIHFHNTPHTILDEYKFPNGWMLRNHFKDLKDIVIFHANWEVNQGRKEKLLKRAGLWFLNETKYVASEQFQVV